MKPIVCAAALLFSLFTQALELLPPTDSMCENGGEMADCGKEKTFYFTNDGSCGCFEPQEITHLDICLRAFIRCTAGATLSFINRWDYSQFNDTPVLAGCGCFTLPE